MQSDQEIRHEQRPALRNGKTRRYSSRTFLPTKRDLPCTCCSAGTRSNPYTPQSLLSAAPSRRYITAYLLPCSTTAQATDNFSIHHVSVQHSRLQSPAVSTAVCETTQYTAACGQLPAGPLAVLQRHGGASAQPSGGSGLPPGGGGPRSAFDSSGLQAARLRRPGGAADGPLLSLHGAAARGHPRRLCCSLSCSRQRQPGAVAGCRRRGAAAAGADAVTA